jgi:large subunit ribosomal protein L19e
MKLNVQKRLAAQILKCSPKRVKFDLERLEEIKESITKQDLRGLISDGAINKVHSQGSSKVRARKIKSQKKAGNRRGQGSRKGKFHARSPRKETWMNAIRKQRALLKSMKENGIVSHDSFKELYKKAKGGFFRSVRHIKLYIEEHEMIIRGKK